MGIDSQIWSILRDREKNFGSFYPNSRKMYKFFYRLRWLTCIPFDEYFTGFKDVFGFIVKKAYRVDEVCNFLDSHRYSIFWSFEMLKKISIDDINLFICRLCGHQDSDKKLKLIVMIQLSFCIWKHLKTGLFEGFDFLFYFLVHRNIDYNLHKIESTPESSPFIRKERDCRKATNIVRRKYVHARLLHHRSRWK